MGNKAHFLGFLAADVVGVPSPAFKSASFFYKTGIIWHDLHKFDLANTCFEKATNLTSRIDTRTVTDDEERKLLLGLNIARSRSAWEVSDRNLAITLLNRAKSVLFGCAENYKALANQYLVRAKVVAEVVSDERVAALFAGDEAVKGGGGRGVGVGVGVGGGGGGGREREGEREKKKQGER